MASMFDRPEDSFTIAERRIELASRAGPLRILGGGHAREFNLQPGDRPAMIAENRSGLSVPLYVELRPRADQIAPTVFVSGQAAVDPSGCVTVDLSVAPFSYAQIILPGERLFVRNPNANLNAAFLVYVVRV